MLTTSATDARSRFGETLKMAQREPVTIRKRNQDTAVLLSAEEYQRLVAQKLRGHLDRLLAESIKKHDALHKAQAR